MTQNSEEGPTAQSTPTQHIVPSPENMASVPAHGDAAPEWTLAPCPDCGGLHRDAERGVLHHDPTCPAAASLAEVVAADADWFADRPGARERRRPLTAAERAEHEIAYGPVPEGMAWAGEVRVVQMAPGIRGRSFAGVSLRPVGGVV